MLLIKVEYNMVGIVIKYRESNTNLKSMYIYI